MLNRIKMPGQTRMQTPTTFAWQLVGDGNLWETASRAICQRADLAPGTHAASAGSDIARPVRGGPGNRAAPARQSQSLIAHELSEMGGARRCERAGVVKF
jgi:hypothetical protein